MCVSYFGNGVFNSLAPVKRGDGVDQPTRMVVEYVSSFFFFSFPPPAKENTALSPALLLSSCGEVSLLCGKKKREKESKSMRKKPRY